MKKLLIVVSLIIVINGAKAQQAVDVGIWAGAGTSFCDMTRQNMGRSLGISYGAFLRYNFNPRVAARLQLINGSIKGEGEFDSHDWSFGPKNVTSLSLMAEINFLRYWLGREETPFTTYLMGGIGLGMYPYDYVYSDLSPVVDYLSDPDVVSRMRFNENYSETVVGLQIPFGFGVKFNLGKKVGIGIELLINRYFSDKIDNLDNPRKNYIIEGKDTFFDMNGLVAPIIIDRSLTTYNDKWHNNDYTAYLGLHLTYKINLKRGVCPVYEYE